MNFLILENTDFCPQWLAKYIWQAIVDKNQYLLILEIHFLILEIHFLILEIHFLIFEINFLILEIYFLILEMPFLILEIHFLTLENDSPILKIRTIF